MTATQTHNPALTNPVLTRELLRQIYAGEVEREPRMEAAVREAARTGSFVCPYCGNDNDGVVRVQSNGMGVESIAWFLKMLMDPEVRDFCLCQLIVKIMQVGGEQADTIADMTRYILPIMRYYMIRLVELARGGEYEGDGIVVLQDTRQSRRLYREGYYKLSDHLLLNATVPQAGGERYCSMKFKGWVGDSWLENCLGQSECYQLFGFNADEVGRAADSTAATAERNEDARLVAAGVRKAAGVRVRYRVGGDRKENYRLADVSALPQTPDSLMPPVSAEGRTVYAIFGFNSEETDRADDATLYDSEERVTLVGEFDPTTFDFKVTARVALMRIAIFPLITMRWNRERCEAFIYEVLGIVWQKSCCGWCVFDKESSKCTPKGVERKRRHPEETADALMVEYHSLCLNERGMLYVKKSLRTVVLSTDQVEAMRLFEERLARLRFSLFEVKRVFKKKGKAARSVIRVASGTRVEMTALFDEHVTRLGLRVKSTHGINYGVFAEPTLTEERIVDAVDKLGRRRKKRIRPEVIFPAVEGFLVLAPERIAEKVQGRYADFERKFAQVARLRKFKLPPLPGATLARQRDAAAAEAKRRAKGGAAGGATQADLFGGGAARAA